MKQKYIAAVIQMNSGSDVASNRNKAGELIEKAVDMGAELIVLPELFTYYGPNRKFSEKAESIEGDTSRFLGELAEKHSIYLHGGSWLEKIDGADRIGNTTRFFGPDGSMICTYRKINLFDVDIPGVARYLESEHTLPGTRAVAVETELGTIGLAICFDIRFPRLFRNLSEMGTHLFAVPAAFTMGTGKDHWHLLLRARAVENLSYVLAANQWGCHPNRMESYGRSCIIDPWGNIIALVPDGVGIATAEIRLDLLEETRKKLPVLNLQSRNQDLENYLFKVKSKS